MAIIPFTYATSFLFTKENTAQNATLMIHMFCGVLLGPVYMILYLFDSTRPYGKGVAWPLRLVPSFAFSCGIINIAKYIYSIYIYIFSLEMFAFMDDRDDVPHELGWEGAGRDLMFLVIDLFLYTIILICAERGLFSIENLAIPKSEKESNYLAVDEDVLKEETRMKEANPKELAICCTDLRKVYRLGLHETLTAVEKISFGLNDGQCFALLGTNGAGKTTTFKMLTTDVRPTTGSVYGCYIYIVDFHQWNGHKHEFRQNPETDRVLPPIERPFHKSNSAREPKTLRKDQTYKEGNIP